MAAKKKRMTQKEKDFNRKYKKELQEKGLIPPDKKRLNRKAAGSSSSHMFHAVFSVGIQKT